MQKKIKTIFIGTPDFGVPSLVKLINDENFDIVSVITQEDKKVGRKQKLKAPAIKQTALKYNLPVLQPKKISDIAEKIKQFAPDLIIVIAYSQIIPKQILNIPKYGVLNIHGSLLPKYRGASCIQAAILNGDKTIGVTIMKMEEGLDTGPILSQTKIKISNIDTTEILFDKLSQLGADILIPVIKNYINNKIKPVAQNNVKSSYVGILKKSDGRIDWNKSAYSQEKFIRAMHPWPGSFGELKTENQTIKIINVKHEPVLINKHKSGTIFLDDNKLFIQCAKDSLEIKKLQLSGKKIMTAQEFINGYSKYIGKILE
ncbi:methionyl-tRNA formyltransferase [Candidatus Parcubacteria bacterium]|nr:methionyl-tRNA formyltransferase [Candidatus Parcubacteria bacterium]